jgi:hypothetical protein
VGSSVSSAQATRRTIILQRVGPVFPYYVYPYPYPYSYIAANYGEVKIDTHHRAADVYIDDGYAATITKSKKFALRPGTHEIGLRSSDGETFYHQRVTVVVGQTTKLSVS